MVSLHRQGRYRRAHGFKVAAEQQGKTVPYVVCPVCFSKVESSSLEIAKEKLSTHIWSRHWRFYEGIKKFNGFIEPEYVSQRH